MYAVFYRNLNLGHRGSPVREVLEESLKRAGAQSARSFQTNGTVLVEAGDPEEVVRLAAPRLKAACGYDDAAFIRPVQLLDQVLDTDPFAGWGDARTYRKTLTFYQVGSPISWNLPWTNTKDDVDIVKVTKGVALGIIRKPKNTAGNPTAEVERETSGPATTRTLGSIERLLRAVADS